MKTSTMRSMFAVAALAAAATASAQTYKVDVPVGFTAGTQRMAAGSYEVRVLEKHDSNPLVVVRNTATAKSTILHAASGADVPKSWKAAGNAVISFECLEGNCALRQMWDGRDSATYRFFGAKLRPSEVQRISSLSLTLTKGD